MKHSELDINLAKIWDRLVKKYDNNTPEFRKYNDLYNFIKVLFLKHDPNPFLSKEKVESDESLQAYYNNHYEQLRLQTDYLVDFFEHAGNFYDMAIPCIVNKNLLSKQEYKKVFALAVDNYKKDEIPYFLTYQFQQSHQKLASFNDFLIEVSDLLTNKESETALDFWINNSKNLFPPENKNLEDNNAEQKIDSNSPAELPDEESNSDSDGFKSSEISTDSNNQNSGDTETAEEQLDSNDEDHDSFDRSYIPGYQIENKSDLTTEEIEHFFSFLHFQSKTEEPFLSQEQVQIMLEKGIRLPEVPLVNKFKLKTSLRKTHKLANYLFHKFYVIYNDREKGKFLQFLGSYIEDYSKALDPTGLDNFRKNFTGKEPKSMVLKIEDFLPERTLIAPIPGRKQFDNSKL